MRVLVTGARGLLGTEVMARLDRSHEARGQDVQDFDITDLRATREAVREWQPEAIIHCAAWSDVDGAESAHDEAFRVNAVGTKNVVLAANEIGARLLHISTDYVFNGRAERPYVESDATDPQGVYGRSKWAAEQMVRELAADWTVLRTQALYGAVGSSFVKAVLNRVAAGEPLRVVEDQVTCPTRAADLAAAVVRVLEEGTSGLYHASSRGECTWFAFAEELLRQVGKPDHPLEPISTAELGRPAPRPAYGVLRNLHLELTIGDPFPDWRAALSAHLAEEGVAP